MAIGHTLLVLSPWRNPIPLRRSWCLWEIVCTLEAPKAPKAGLLTHSLSTTYFGAISNPCCVFDVALPEAQQGAFEAALHTDLASIKGPIQG